MPMIGIASEEEYEVNLAKSVSRSYLKWNINFNFIYISKEYDGCFNLLDHREVRH